MAGDGVAGGVLSEQEVVTAVGTARTVVGWLVGGLTGFTVSSAAECNAWEVARADQKCPSSGAP